MLEGARAPATDPQLAAAGVFQRYVCAPARTLCKEKAGARAQGAESRNGRAGALVSRNRQVGAVGYLRYAESRVLYPRILGQSA